MPQSDQCPIWGGGTVLPNHTGFDGIEVDNPRAGGRYKMAGSVVATFAARRTDELAAKLTTWIVDEHRNGIPSPLISTAVLDRIRDRRRLGITQQIHRFFLLLIYRRFRANDHLKHAGQVDENYRKDTADLAAWMECENNQEQSAIIRLLDQDGLIHSQGSYITITPAGVRKLEEIQTSQKESRQAFVAMWFDPSMDTAYSEGISKAIEQSGYTPIRIDKKEHSNKIDDEIIAEIRRSRFVVADFTCGTIDNSGNSLSLPRGGVYFEAGFAMGLGIQVIWCCRKDMIDQVHFDTRQFAHVIWETPADLKERLYNRINAVIVEGRAS